MTRLAAFRTLSAAALVALAIGARQPSTFQDLLSRYQGSDADRAIAEFAAWPYTKVETDAVLTSAQQGDPWTVAALVLFHLETDLVRSARVQALSVAAASNATVNSSRFHMQRAEGVIQRVLLPLAEQRKDADLLAFVRDWLMVRQRAWAGMTARLTPSMSWDEFAAPYFRRDPLFQLLVGIDYFWQMGPLTEAANPYGVGMTAEDRAKYGVISVGRQQFNAKLVRETELAFRRALELDATLAEARLRLGRLYQVLGREGDARTELERAWHDAGQTGDKPTQYLSSLFLGQLDEDAGQFQSAIGRLKDGLDVYPSGMAARLALGDLLLTQGQTADGWAAVRGAVSADTATALRDPWAVYGALGYWQDLAPRLVAMRSRVSKTPFVRPAAILARALSDDQAAQAPAPQQIGRVFRGGVEVIRVEALVTNNDIAVPGLTESDFVVKDNGVEQKVTRAAQANSLSLGLVLDASTSLSSSAGFSSVRRATRAIVDALSPLDMVAVVSAGDRARLRTELIHPGRDLEAAINSSLPGLDDLTAIWDAVLVANSLIVDGTGRVAAIVVSDGEDTASWISRATTLARANRRGLVFDAIDIPWSDTRGPSFDASFGEIGLRAPVAAAGGVVFNAKDPQLPARIKARFDALRHSYLLTYSAERAVPQKDGWHEIKVSLRPGLKGTVQARPGYYESIKR